MIDPAVYTRILLRTHPDVLPSWFREWYEAWMQHLEERAMVELSEEEKDDLIESFGQDFLRQWERFSPAEQQRVLDVVARVNMDERLCELLRAGKAKVKEIRNGEPTFTVEDAPDGG
jgi:hypothetical protein